MAGTAFEAEGGARDAPATWARRRRRPRRAAGLEIAFRTDPAVFDGRFANNGWLQELPKPLTKITWDNVALVSPKTAAALGGVRTEQTASGHVTEVAELTLGGRSVKAPLWVLPGHADGAVTVHLGYGRTRAGRVGNGRRLRRLRAAHERRALVGGRARGREDRRDRALACTQDHWTMEATAHEQAQSGTSCGR